MSETLVMAIECGIECIQMFREKELLDAAKFRHRGLCMNEASAEHAAASLQKHIDALQRLLNNGSSLAPLVAENERLRARIANIRRVVPDFLLPECHVSSYESEDDLIHASASGEGIKESK
jgi:hypothetical protein